MSTLPTSEEMSWLFSSPGSVLAMAIWRSREGWILHDAEARDVAAELVEPLEAPGAHQAVQAPARDAVSLLEHRAHRLGIEQAERALEDRADLVAGLQHIDRMDFHQRLQPLGERRLAAADRAEQVEDLLALLEALRGVAEEADDPLDRLLHAVEAGEGRIGADRPVHEDPAEARILGRVDDLRLADRGQQALGRVGVAHRVAAASFEIFRKRHLRFTPRLEGTHEGIEDMVVEHGILSMRCRPSGFRRETPTALTDTLYGPESALLSPRLDTASGDFTTCKRRRRRHCVCSSGTMIMQVRLFWAVSQNCRALRRFAGRNPRASRAASRPRTVVAKSLSEPVKKLIERLRGRSARTVQFDGIGGEADDAFAVGALELGEADRRILAGEQSAAKAMGFLDYPAAAMVAAQNET